VVPDESGPAARSEPSEPNMHHTTRYPSYVKWHVNGGKSKTTMIRMTMDSPRQPPMLEHTVMSAHGENDHGKFCFRTSRPQIGCLFE